MTTTSLTTKKRENDLDIAKGVGIILVVWAHALGPFSNYINQFHMPFFFFISGMLYHDGGNSCYDFIKKKVRQLLYPFWIWNLLMFPVFFILYHWNRWMLLDFFKGIIEIIMTLNKVPFLGATWFLPALFWISILFHLCINATNNMTLSEILTLLSTGILCWIGFKITLPYKWSRNLICLLFYVSGYFYKKYFSKYKSFIFGKSITILNIVIFIFIASINTIDMGSNIYEFKLLFIIGAFAAIQFMLYFSAKINHFVSFIKLKNHLIYLGQNTIDIVIWQFLAFRITILFQILIENAKLNSLIAFPVYDSSQLWWGIYILSGIYGSLFISKVITKIMSVIKYKRAVKTETYRETYL